MKFLAFLLTTLLACLAQRDDLLVGILGTSQQKRENFYQLTKPEIIPFLLDEAEPESSNWVIEEADRWRRFDYDKALRLVRKKFRENFQLRQPRVRIKYLPFATNDDLRKNIKLVSESSAKFKVFLFGRNSHDVTDVCGLVKGLSRVQNVSAIIWGCPETHTAIQNGLLSLAAPTQSICPLIFVITTPLQMAKSRVGASIGKALVLILWSSGGASTI